MLLNLGKFKQWTGEKFGGAKVTLQTEDFQRLEQETEDRREGYDKIIDSVEILLNYILKKKQSPEDRKAKMAPLELFGSCLYHYGTVFPEDSPLGIALLNLGQTETRISGFQEKFGNEIKSHYMNTLEYGANIYKEYDTLRKKLASRRLDYDSKLNRLNKAKSEKPELEQEMQAAKIKYEDTEHDLIHKMSNLQEFENEHRDALMALINAQLAYHNQAKDLLLSLKSKWDDNILTESDDMLGNAAPRDEHTDNSHHSVCDKSSSHTSASTVKSNDILGKVIPQDEQTDESHKSVLTNASTVSLTTSQKTVSRATSDESLSSHRSTASRKKNEHYRKALYDFAGQNEDEVSFKIGDIISVISEIDKGWWVGEVHGERGIFPVNFTEHYDPHKQPLPPLPTNEPPPSQPKITNEK